MPHLPFRDHFSVALTVASAIREHKLSFSCFWFPGWRFFLRALGIPHVQLLASLLTLIHHLQVLFRGYITKYYEQLTCYMWLEIGQIITLQFYGTLS